MPLQSRSIAHAVAVAYIVWALPLALLLAWVVPPWTNTDETFHLLRAVNVAHGHMLGSRFDHIGPGLPLGSGGPSDIAILEAFKPMARLSWLPNRPNGEVTGANLKASEAIKWRRGMVPVWFGTTAQYPPLFYLPDVIGYWLGRVTHSHVDGTLRLARSLNAVLFVGLAAIAIGRSRRLLLLLTAILMLPMTIALAASANQDAGMIAFMALAVSQIDRIADEQRCSRPIELSCIAAALACIAMGRPPYAALLFVFLPLAKGRSGRVACIIAVTAVAVWCSLVAIFVMRPLTDQANPNAQLASLMADPLSVAMIGWNTLRSSIGAYAWEFVGQLAWNDVPLPHLYLVLAGVVLAITGLASMAGPSAGRREIIVAAVCVIVGVHALLYFDWTPPGAKQVDGVNGRHFLPLALAIGLALPSWKQASRFWLPAAGALLLLGVSTPAVMVFHVIKHFFITSS